VLGIVEYTELDDAARRERKAGSEHIGRAGWMAID
jgi:hypothetical protein